MAEPWRCPECKTWIAPGVAEHRCDPDGGVLAAVGAPAPTQPPASVTVTGAPHMYRGTGSTTSSMNGVTFTVTANGRELAEAVSREMQRWNLRQGGRGLRAV